MSNLFFRVSDACAVRNKSWVLYDSNVIALRRQATNSIAPNIRPVGNCDKTISSRPRLLLRSNAMSQVNKPGVGGGCCPVAGRH